MTIEKYDYIKSICKILEFRDLKILIIKKHLEVRLKVSKRNTLFFRKTINFQTYPKQILEVFFNQLYAIYNKKSKYSLFTFQESTTC